MWRRHILPPTECALVVAIPLDEAGFFADARRGTDFVATYADSTGLTRPGDLWCAYQPYALLCRRLVSDVRDDGVRVLEGATLDTLATAIRLFNAVTLVAHARGPEIRPRDIVDSPLILARSLRLAETLDAPPLVGQDRAAIA